MKPRHLKLTSRRHRVRGYLEPAAPFAAKDIDISSIRLNGTVPVDPAARTSLGDHDKNGIPDLKVKFRWRELKQTLSKGDSFAVTVTGMVAGQRFLGTTHIRVHHVSGKFSIETAGGAGDRVSSRLALAIRGTTPNPAVGGRMRVTFALHDASAARLELLDIAGRAVISREVGAMGPGVHALDLSDGRALRPGIYFLRLTQGRNEVRARATVLR